MTFQCAQLLFIHIYRVYTVYIIFHLLLLFFKFFKQKKIYMVEEEKKGEEYIFLMKHFDIERQDV